MTVLPTGWATITIGEASGVGGLSTDGDWIESKDQDPTGSVRLIQLQDIGDGTFVNKSSRFLTEEKAEELNCTFLSPGDVLIARMPDPLGRACRFPDIGQKSVTAVDVHVWRKGEHGVEPDFLVYCVNSPEIRQSLQAQASGTTRQRVSGGRLKAQEIPLPPLREQRRIVRKLDTLSARSTTARTHLTAIEKLVERYKRGVLGQFFPEDLPKTPLGKSCTKIGSGATPRGGKNVYLAEGTPLIRSQNVRFEGFDWDGLAFISDEHADELRNVTVRSGDVLLNITGASIGRVCLAPEEMEGARVNQHVSIIRPKPQELDARFVHHFLSSPMIQNWIWNENYGVTRQALTKGMIEEIGVPDVPIEEQREIVRRIETAFAKIDRLKAEAAKALKLLGHLDQRILTKAFAGDLVPQDPNDEPASVLLERIREARATAPKKQRQRRTKAYAMKEAPKDRLLADSATWPRNGLPFEDIATRVTMPHDELRDAIFELLGGEKPLLEQVFDTAEERMRLKRVAQ